MSMNTCNDFFFPFLDAGDLSSASEDDNSDDDSDSRDLAAYHCRHCFSTCKYLILMQSTFTIMSCVFFSQPRKIGIMRARIRPSYVRIAEYTLRNTASCPC